MDVGAGILGKYKYGGIPYIAQYQSALQRLIRRCTPMLFGNISSSYYTNSKGPTLYCWFPLFMRNIYSAQFTGNRYVNIITLTKSSVSHQRVTGVTVKSGSSTITSTTTSVTWQEANMNNQWMSATKTVIDTTLLPEYTIDNGLKIVFTLDFDEDISDSNTLCFVEYQQFIDIQKKDEINKFDVLNASDFLITSVCCSGLFTVRENDSYDKERPYALTAVAIPELSAAGNYYKLKSVNSENEEVSPGTVLHYDKWNYTLNDDGVIRHHKSCLVSDWFLYEYNSFGVLQRSIKPVVTFFGIYSKKTKIPLSIVNQKSLNDTIFSGFDSPSNIYPNRSDKPYSETEIDIDYLHQITLSPVDTLSREIKPEDYSVINQSPENIYLSIPGAFKNPVGYTSINLIGDGTVLTKDTTSLLYLWW